MKERSQIRFARYLIGAVIALAALSNILEVSPRASGLGAGTEPSVRDSRLNGGVRIGDGFSKRSDLDRSILSRPSPAFPVSMKNLLATASAFSPASPSVSAMKSHMLSDPQADPGDTITYTVVISNTGMMDATGVNFSDTIDPNTTLVANSLIVSPIAVNDSYNTIGNVNIDVPAPGLLANDLNPNGSGTLTIQSPPTTTTNGGTLSINPTTGAFTYNPPVGFEGMDTFDYTLGNGTGKTDTATVTITVSGLIWFVDSAAVMNGDGRLSSPFNILTGMGSADSVDTANDVIFLYSSMTNYTGGITLLSAEKVIGQGASQSILTITGFTMPSGNNLLPTTGGSDPMITTVGTDAITLGTNNGLHGFTVGNTGAAGTDISGSSFGTLTVRDVTVNGTGRGLNLATGTIASGSTFDSIESSGGSNNEGVRLNAVGGSFTATTTNIVNPTGTGIDVQSSTSGANFSFGNTTANKGSTSGTGVNLNSNAGSTISFSSLAVTTNNGTGVSATSSGTVNVSGGSINATGGPALLSNPTMLGMSFTNVSSTGSSATGISLTSASGSLTIGSTTVTNAASTGILVQSLASGATASFGNTSITNPDGDTTGGTGVRLIDNLGNVSFADLDITPETNQRGLHATNGVASSGTITTTSGTISTTSQPAVEIDGPAAKTSLNVTLTSVSTNGGPNGIALIDTGGSFTVVGTGTANSGGTIQNTTGADNAQAGNGIFLMNADDVSFDRMLLTTHDNFAIKGTTVNGFEFLNSTINGTNGNNDGADEACIFFSNLVGTGLINNSTIEGGVESNIRVINSTGSLNALQVMNSTIRSNSATTGGDGIFARAQSGATMVVKVTGCTMHSNRDDHIQTDAENSGNMTTVVTGNTLTSNGTVGAPAQASTLGGGVTITGGAAFSSSTSTYNVSNNTITGAKTAPITINVVSVTSTAAGLLSGTINNNTLGQAGSANSGSSSSDGISVLVNGASTVNATITNNQIRQFNNIGIQIIKRDGPGNMNATVTGNTVAEPVAPNALQGITVTSGATATDTGTTCADIGGAGGLANIVTGPNFGGDLIRVRQRFGTIVRLPGFVDGPDPDITVDVVNYLIGRNTITNEAPNAKASATTQAPGSFATPGGAACTAGAMPSSIVLESEMGGLAQAGVETSQDEGGDIVDLNLMATYGKRIRQQGDDEAEKLTQDELNEIVRAAIRRWIELGVSFEELARIEAMTFELGSLPDNKLAQSFGKRVRIDRTAADYGWFVDPTPFDELEFETVTGTAELEASERSPAFRRIDLLTVVMRQLGNALDKDNPYRQHRRRGLMLGTIDASQRRLPSNGLLRIGQIKPVDENVNHKDLVAADLAGSKGVLSIATRGNDGAIHSNGSSINTFAGSERLRSTLGASLAQAGYRADPNTPLANRARLAGLGRASAPPVAATASPSGETVAKMIGTIPPNESVTIMFQVTIDNPFPPNVCDINNSATISGSNFMSLNTNTDTVTLTIPPTIMCPSDFMVNTDPGMCTASVSWMTTATGCPPPTVSCSDGMNTITSPHNFPVGMTTVTCTATSTSGSAMCSFNVTVTDNQNPMISCPASFSQNTDPNVCTAVVSYMVTATDNCGAITPMCTPASGSTFPKGTTTVNCTATDPSNNMASCMFTVTINDNQAPSVGPCPANVNTSTDPGMCSAVVMFTTPPATDNCPPVNPTVVCSPPSGTAFPDGMTTVTCTATDASMNMGSCFFVVTVTDNESPVLSCPPDNGAFAPSSDCLPPTNSAYAGTTTVNFPTGNSLSGDNFLFQFSACDAPPAAMAGSMTTKTVNALDRGTITISPGSPMSFQAPAVVMVKTTFNNQSGGTRTFDTEMLQLDISGGNLPAGVMIRESPTMMSTGQTKITDASGGGFRIDSFFDIFVELSVDGGQNWIPGVDGMSQPVALHVDLVQTTDPNACDAAGVKLTPTTATDNCDTVTVMCTPASGSTFPKGVTTINCSAMDLSGNTGNCSYIITVIDAQLPSLTCPANIAVDESSPGSGSATVTYTTPTPTDNCPMPTASCSPASGSSFPVGTTTVTCTATDMAGNTNTCTFTVMVNPLCALMCNPNITTSTDPNLCAAVVTYSAPTVSGSCGEVTCSPASGFAFPKGVTTVTCTSMVGPSCMFTVTVNDTQNPTLNNCPTNVTTSTDPDVCTAAVTYTDPTASDNCPGVGTPTCSPASGFAFPKGTTTVTCSVMDASGNSASCDFTVTVNDTQNPTLNNCPTNITTSTDLNMCTAVVNYTDPTATDNCPGVGTPSCSPASGTAFPKGTTTVTCSVTDAVGNPASCSFTVTVNDTQNPTITSCPSNIVTTTDPGLCTAVVMYSPTASDNCPGVTVACNPASGSAFPKGTTTVSCTATDTSGNQSTACMFTVTVNDNEMPSIACPANITTPTAPNLCEAVVNYTVMASDNCPGVTVASNPPSGSAFPKGTTTVTATATDVSGNQKSCSFTVTVVDMQMPSITCPANIVTASEDPGGTTVQVFYPAPMASDNCPGVGVACVPPSGSFFPRGTTTVTCTATDTSGNAKMCSFTITFFDVCIENESPFAAMMWNSADGQYMVCCGGNKYTGKGTATRMGNIFTLTHLVGNRRINGTADKGANRGTGAVKNGTVTACSIYDRNLRNNTGLCP
ncbi:MAG TPA: HYR domain-containing protein [Blastocatellia bacterium]|nr:HYR domain-containing protein [Blastocatellia bacterium]